MCIYFTSYIHLFSNQLLIQQKDSKVIELLEYDLKGLYKFSYKLKKSKILKLSDLKDLFLPDHHQKQQQQDSNGEKERLLPYFNFLEPNSELITDPLVRNEYKQKNSDLIKINLNMIFEQLILLVHLQKFNKHLVDANLLMTLNQLGKIILFNI